jgi:hypothetical protein
MKTFSCSGGIAPTVTPVMQEILPENVMITELCVLGRNNGIYFITDVMKWKN